MGQEAAGHCRGSKRRAAAVAAVARDRTTVAGKLQARVEPDQYQVRTWPESTWSGAGAAGSRYRTPTQNQTQERERKAGRGDPLMQIRSGSHSYRPGIQPYSP